MVSLKQALVNAAKLRPEYMFTGGLDFGDYYFFSIFPKNEKPDGYVDGFICIDKKSGEEKYINPLANPQVFMSGNPIDIFSI